jgi:hypothetical protein
MPDDFSKGSLIESLREGSDEANLDIHYLERAAKTIAASPQHVLALLTDFVSDASRLSSLARRAYQHPNGFAKFVLHDSPDLPVRLRLHVWTGDSSQRIKQDEQNIHGHRWNFASAVIAGQHLRVDEFVRVETGGAPYLSYRYRPQHRTLTSGDDGAELPVDTTELEADGSARLEQSVGYSLAAGDSYSCDISKLHTVRTSGTDLIATLVVQGPTLLTNAPVYRRIGYPYQASAQPIGIAEARRILTETADAVARHASAWPDEHR